MTGGLFALPSANLILFVFFFVLFFFFFFVNEAITQRGCNKTRFLFAFFFFLFFFSISLNILKRALPNRLISLCFLNKLHPDARQKSHLQILCFVGSNPTSPAIFKGAVAEWLTRKN